MGRKGRLNKLITKWIKSDLPEDRSTVLLLRVTSTETPLLSAHRCSSLPPEQADLVSCNDLRQQQHRLSFLPPETAVISNSQQDSPSTLSSSHTWNNESPCKENNTLTDSDVTFSISILHDQVQAMDRSVDSIGNCSLDVEAPPDVSDHCEASSLSTLRSLSILIPSPEPHLPSYLSLACTVNGYSPTTKYDSQRLSKSRDASPHRFQEQEHLTSTYKIHNNLLSPPNLVPLPTVKKEPLQIMSDKAVEHHDQTFNSTKTLKFSSKKFTKSVMSSDCIDICRGNGSFDENIKIFTRETKTVSNNGHKYSAEGFFSSKESKSFIQQRVERLYGPGALAQGFFVMKRQKSRYSESDSDKQFNTSTDEKHSKSLCDQFEESEMTGADIKTSCSSPTLPVLRHLRPEFRAQLPIIRSRQATECGATKNNLTKVTEKDKENNQTAGASVSDSDAASGKNGFGKTNTPAMADGHYFLQMCMRENGRLLNLANQAEAEAEQMDLPEEIKGKLRSAYGKARLLVSQKMEQFKGLCANNINQSNDEQFPTTNEDLQGFWDMVMLQVGEVNALFDEIEMLRKNDWQVKSDDVQMNGQTNGVAKKSKKIMSARRSPTAATEAIRKQRDAARKEMMEARRKAMKMQKQSSQNIEIFIPESS